MYSPKNELNILQYFLIKPPSIRLLS